MEDNELTVACIKFPDRGFTQYREASEIIQVRDKISVAFYEHGMDEERLICSLGTYR
jgi:hypothetical protein